MSMQLEMEEILSPRIKMHVNGHRYLAGFRVDHPGYPQPTEYAIFEANGDFYISVSSGGDTKMGRLASGNDADVIDDAHRAVDDFHSVDRSRWHRRETILTI
jgi:hypothetical protein